MFDDTKYELVHSGNLVCDKCVHEYDACKDPAAGDCASTPCLSTNNADGRPRVLLLIQPDQGGVRSTDPATSHEAAAKVSKTLRQAMLDMFDTDQRFANPVGYTGHEMAKTLNRALNSITPRFAEMRKAGLIRNTSLKRDGQIVWVRT